MVKWWKNLPGDGGEVERDVLGARVARWETGLRRVLEIEVRLSGRDWLGEMPALARGEEVEADDVRPPGCRVRERKGVRLRVQRANNDAPWVVAKAGRWQRECWWMEDRGNNFL